MTKRKVVFLIPDLSLGGAQKQCLELASAINKYSHLEVSIVTFRNSGEMLHLISGYQIEIQTLGFRSGFDVRNSIKLRKHLIDSGCTILVTWLHSADVIGFFATRFTRVDWIVNERDSFYPSRIRYLIRIVCCAFASSIIANSLQGLLYWKRKYFWKSVFLVKNIVERRDTLSISFGYDVIFGGRFTTQKRVIETALVLERLVRSNPHLRVAMVGEGENFNDVRDIFGDLIGSENVRLTGYSNSFRDILSNSKSLISLSSHEGAPNVVLEAIAQGIVPILSDIPEHVAIVGEKYPFLISDVTRIEEIVDLVLAAISTEDRGFMEQSFEYLRECEPKTVVGSVIKVFEEGVT
jgi:glycosyltransferase involved in cell wall biosynthesis